MAEIISLDSKRDEQRQQMLEKAAEIASLIDPNAGGFFKRNLERAALSGMEWAKGLSSHKCYELGCEAVATKEIKLLEYETIQEAAMGTDKPAGSKYFCDEHVPR